mgnify:CR=1 FL=1
MADTIYTYALSTVARLKARMGITETGFDTVFISYLNAATDFIENYCDRHFAEKTYTNEVYSIPDAGKNHLILKQAPVSSVTSFQYRTGMLNAPNYTDFLASDWAISEDGKAGIIEYGGSIPQGPNSVRVSYVAGYKIDFTHYGDNTLHTLPADLTELCERLAIKRFKRREAEGKSNESFNGASIAWADLLDESDKDILDGYCRDQFI